jgi:predicted ATPase
LRGTSSYRRIVETIRQIAPWFGDFVLQPSEKNKRFILLNWRERGSDMVFDSQALSDGTLRAMGLVTLLLQPTEDLPSLVVIDEPELGLHPYAIVTLAALMKQAACHCQIIAATQSTALLDQFRPEDVIVVDRDDRASVFRRVPEQMSEKQLDEWLAEYSLGELWEKNVLGGGPA